MHTIILGHPSFLSLCLCRQELDEINQQLTFSLSCVCVEEGGGRGRPVVDS